MGPEYSSFRVKIVKNYVIRRSFLSRLCCSKLLELLFLVMLSSQWICRFRFNRYWKIFDDFRSGCTVWCLRNEICFMFGLLSNLQVWNPAIVNFDFLFAVDSVLSVDFKWLKGVLKSLFAAHWDTASNMLVLFCWRLILIGASPRFVLFPGGNSRGNVGIGSHFADSL